MKRIAYPELSGEMARRGDTQKTLGDLLGLTSSCISKRLSGEVEWSISEIDKICEFYNKDYYALFKRSKDIEGE